MPVPLTSERWQRIEAIFNAALEQAEPARSAVVSQLAEGDAGLIAEVQGMLSACDRERLASASSVRAAEPQVAGRRLGNYELDGTLGHGGMGVVYLAHRADGQFQQQVALKLLGAHLRTEFFTGRFQAERQILADLNHPNITRLTDSGVGPDGDPYLVMEYVDGQPIDAYCDARRLTVADRLRCFLQVCTAVEYAHRHLIVHRDLKPGNMMVTGEGVVKLLDFGTAKLLSIAEADATLTRFRMMTPRYASPEQLRGEAVSTLTDVYSLGIVLYELMTGAWPFGDPQSAVAGLERAVRDIDPAKPSAVTSDAAAATRSVSKARLERTLDGDLSNVVLKAIHPDPLGRYSSVEQFSADVRRYLEGRPVLARARTLPYRAARFMRRHRWPLAASALVAAALAFSALSAFRQYGREQRRLVQLRELSQSYLTDIFREVSSLPGSTKARLMIVDRARKNLDELLPEAPDDPALRRALANAYIQLGIVQGEPFTVSLGDTAGALASYRKAEALAVGGAPRDWETVWALIRARQGIAAIQLRAGGNRQAAATLRGAIDPAYRLWKEGPRTLANGVNPAGVYVRANQQLGHALLRDADASRSLSGLRQALDQLEHTVAVAEQVQSRDPEVPDLAARYSQFVGFALEDLGDATGDRSYYPRAAAAHRRATESAAKVYEKAPNPQSQRDYADGLSEFSWALRLAGENQEAVRTAQQAVGLMEQVSKADPNSSEARQDVADAYFHLGAAEIGADRLRAGLGHLRLAESMVELPAQVQATDREIVERYIKIREQLAAADMRLQDRAAARDALAEAVRAAERLAVLPEWRVAEVRRELELASF